MMHRQTNIRLMRLSCPNFTALLGIVLYVRAIKSRASEMGGACGMNGGDENYIQCFGGET